MSTGHIRYRFANSKPDTEPRLLEIEGYNPSVYTVHAVTEALHAALVPKRREKEAACVQPKRRDHLVLSFDAAPGGGVPRGALVTVRRMPSTYGTEPAVIERVAVPLNRPLGEKYGTGVMRAKPEAPRPACSVEEDERPRKRPRVALRMIPDYD